VRTNGVVDAERACRKGADGDGSDDVSRRATVALPGILYSPRVPGDLPAPGLTYLTASFRRFIIFRLLAGWEPCRRHLSVSGAASSAYRRNTGIPLAGGGAGGITGAVAWQHGARTTRSCFNRLFERRRVRRGSMVCSWRAYDGIKRM